jgi:hypothetical protein
MKKWQRHLFIFVRGSWLCNGEGNAWAAKDSTFCKLCVDHKGKWCQLDFIYKGCQKCLDVTLDACKQAYEGASAKKQPLKQLSGPLKDSFCQFICISGLCASSLVLGATCVTYCPKDKVVNCTKAYEDALRKKTQEKELEEIVSPMAPPVRITPYPVQTKGPENMPRPPKNPFPIQIR